MTVILKTISPIAQSSSHHVLIRSNLSHKQLSAANFGPQIMDCSRKYFFDDLGIVIPPA